MRTALLYMLQVLACSGILYGYYHLFLRNKRFHQYNRYYLLLAVVVSSIIPFLQIPVYIDGSDTEPLLVKTLTVFSAEGYEEDMVISSVAARQTWFTWKNVLSVLYVLTALILFIRFWVALIWVIRLFYIYPAEKLGNIRFIPTNEPAAPFSFFRWLFWNNKIELNSDNGQQIFRHELFHIRQKHSWDIIFLEIITLIFWINPFFHLIKKEIKAIHEFLADNHAAEENKEWDYAELLLMQVLGSPNTRLTNPFFHNQIKRRIAMLTTSKKPGYQYLRKIMVLPLAAIIIGLFAFTYRNKRNHDASWSAEPITIVVDAGHGGTDHGASSPGNEFKEAALTLEIAKTIKALAKEYNISVVMTREDEKFPGNSVDKDEALRKRIELTEKVNPVAFISVHINTTADNNTQKNHSGFEAYVSKKEDARSERLASEILQNLSTTYKTREETRIRKTSGIYVLDKNSSPAILLQCGFINNPDDLAFINDKNNQEKIARRILEGVVNFNDASKMAGFLPAAADTIPGKVDNKIFEKVEIEPAFQGGETGWGKFLDRNMDRNLPVDKGAPKGHYTVFIQFIVDKDGSVTDLRPLTKHGYGMEQEASRLIEKGPKWLPGIQNGIKVKAYKKQRFDFIIPDSKKSEGSLTADTIKPNKEVVVVGYATKNTIPSKKVEVEGKPIPIKEVTVTGYPAKKPAPEKKVIVEGKPIPIKEVTVQGYPIKNPIPKNEVIMEEKPNQIKEVIVPGYPAKKPTPGKKAVIEEKPGQNLIFEKVETEPSFPGGKPAWSKYLEKNANPSVPVDKGAPAGVYKVEIRYIVNADGTLSDIEALTNHGYGMEEEAIRLLKNSPVWIPAIQNGKKVNAYRKQLVTFMVKEEQEKKDGVVDNGPVTTLHDLQ